MWIRSTALAFLLVGTALAGDAPAPPKDAAEAADRAVAAFKSKNAAGLKSLVGTDGWDPWSVVEELCERKEFDAAEALAKADATPEMAKLPAYARRRRGELIDPVLREAVRKVRALPDSATWNWGDVAPIVAELDLTPTDDATCIVLLYYRGQALHSLGGDAYNPAGRDEYEAAVSGAARIGWLRMELRSTMALFLTYVHDDAKHVMKLARRGSELSRAQPDKGLRLSAAAALAMACDAVGDVDGKIRAELDVSALGFEVGNRLAALNGLNSAANALMIANRPKEAQPHLERVLKFAQEDRDEAAELDALDTLAMCLWMAKDRTALGALCDKFLPRWPAARRPEVLRWKLSLASEAGDWKSVVEIAGAQEAAAQEAHDQESMVDARAQRGLALRSLGRIDEATAATLSAVELLATLTGDSSRARAGFTPGGSLLALGRAREALPLLIAGADAAESTPASDLDGAANPARAKVGRSASESLDPEATRSHQLVIMLGLVGAAQLEVGDAAAARTTALRSLRLALSPQAVSGAWRSLGRADDALGDVAAALSDYEKAVDFAVKAGETRDIAESLMLVGDEWNKIGEPGRALESDARVVDLRRKLPSEYGLAQALHNHALTRCRQGQAEACLADEREALAIFQRLKMPRHESAVLNGLGVALEKLGRIDEASAQFEAAVDAAARATDVRGTALPLLNLARFAKRRGDDAKSRALNLRALDAASPASDAQCLALGQAAADDLKAGDAAAAIRRLHQAVDVLAHRFDGLADEESAHARSSRADVFRLGLEAAVAAKSLDEALFFLEAGRARSFLMSIGGRAALRAADVPEELRKLEIAADARVRRVRRSLDDAVEAGRVEESRHWNRELEAAQSDLGNAAARIQREARGAGDLFRPTPVAFAALQALLGADDALVEIGRVENRWVTLLVTKKAARLVDGPPVEATPREFSPEDLDAWRERLAKPLGAPSSIRRVLVCPPAELAQAPWCRILEGREVAYVPSATVYAALRSAPPSEARATLALGAPQYRSGSLAPLPGSGKEAQAVGDVVLLGGEATKSALISSLSKKPRWRSVHIACHGLMNSELPMTSALALTPTTDDDGRLTAREVAGLSVPADLVVLSACRSAVGRAYEAEGVVGFVRVFVLAGTSRVLVSIWKVDDDATCELMTKFYELWNPKDGSKGMPAAEALKKAMEHVAAQEKWKDPKYWAAWQLWGLPQ